jgi:hypothetical protein
MMAGACMKQFIHELRAEAGMSGLNDWALRRAIDQGKASALLDLYNGACSMEPFPKLDIGTVPQIDPLTGMTIPSEPYKAPEPRVGTERTRRNEQVEQVEQSEQVSANVKHRHYFRDISKLTELDVYRICDLYVDDRSGATQHAIKKLLLPGQRGAKDRAKDIQEAVDTLNRKLQMIKEDAA